jgi:hypothetical protein
MYADDIFNVISCFLAMRDFETTYKIILYSVKQVVHPPPHLLYALCVTIGNSPMLNERYLKIAEKTFLILLKVYGPGVVYSSYWTALNEHQGCLLHSRTKWLLKMRRYSELQQHLSDCQIQIGNTQRVTELISSCLHMIPSQVQY